MSKAPNTLDDIQLLKGLPPEVRARIAQNCAWRTYAPDEFVVGELDEGRDVYFIVLGVVRVVGYSDSGKEVIYRDIEAGHLFGEFAAIDGRPRSATVVALEKSTLASLSAERFWKLLLENPDFAAAVMKYLTAQIRALTERVFEFSTLAVKNRIHAELLRLATHHQTGDNTAVIAPAPTHADIASRVSTHREAVTRELSSLARAGIIQRDTGQIAVPDIERLRHLVGDILGHRIETEDLSALDL